MTLAALLSGPATYVPRTGWPAWAVLPAAVGIFTLAALGGLGAMWALGDLSGFEPPADMETVPEHVMSHLVTWLAGLQAGVILLTLAAAGLYSSDRAQALALVRPESGWGVLPLALVPLFVGTAVWSGLLLAWKPDTILQDLRPFQQLLSEESPWLVLLIICVGAPLSEELLFRGFLFSALAKSRLGLLGASLLTALLWTALHAGYSLYGLIEVFGIGLYFSWLLVRTGSLWVTIFCHAAYNTVISMILLLVALPAPA